MTAAPASLPTIPAEAPTTVAPDRSLSLWPWLLAALALGAGGAFLFWRRSSREAYAGGPQVDEFTGPEPQPQPQPRSPAPAPSVAPAQKPTGFVSSTMRPWIDIGFTPLRCIVDNQQVALEFELELFNSGNAPAHEIMIRAHMLNAGPTQDEEIGRFFAARDPQGERISLIPPLQQVAMRSQLSVPIDQVRVLEAGGRQVFVPLIGFTVLYGAGDANQTCVVYLVGRETKADKLAPFRLDLGPRVFRGLGARALPVSVRR